MFVSNETPSESAARLLTVIANAKISVLETPYTFVEFPLVEFPALLVNSALAFVRDESVWSALVPSARETDEKFVVFRFHFTPGLDNSGFVGWLASHLKAKVGTGVFVVCGQNSVRGGIFDYWGAPLCVAAEVIQEVRRLRGEIPSMALG